MDLIGSLKRGLNLDRQSALEPREILDEAGEGGFPGEAQVNPSNSRRARRARWAALRPRNVSAMKALRRFGMLTTEQAARATGYKKSAICRALKELADEGIASYGGFYARGDRETLVVPTKASHVYTLTPAGRVRCITEGLADESDLIYCREWKRRAIRDNHIYHHLAIVDCMISCWWEFAALPGYQLTEMIPDFIKVHDGVSMRRVTTEVIGSCELPKSKQKRIEPDAIIKLTNRVTGKTGCFFIEIDRQTTSMETVADKLKKYDEYLQWEKRRHQADLTLIIYAATNDRRINAILKDKHISWHELTKVRKQIRFGVLPKAGDPFLQGKWLTKAGKHLPLITGAA